MRRADSVKDAESKNHGHAIKVAESAGVGLGGVITNGNGVVVCRPVFVDPSVRALAIDHRH
ncbi:hypothetical protein H7J83_15015 [Mycobacterium mantenii]|uniref:hypothetical protein n=1 Tax=Mycobacterium mantenii TaxID=560555 RepID=UPI0015D24A16|nr:hypothetical protein [Mycobacterium mantenii]MCV7244029.1 hypothetical protein [Mycobacterium mantenii]